MLEFTSAGDRYSPQTPDVTAKGSKHRWWWWMGGGLKCWGGEQQAERWGKIWWGFGLFYFPGGYMETEAAAQESLGLGKLGTQAEKDRRLKKKWVSFLCDFLAETWFKYQDFYCFTQTCNEK